MHNPFPGIPDINESKLYPPARAESKFSPMGAMSKLFIIQPNNLIKWKINLATQHFVL